MLLPGLSRDFTKLAPSGSVTVLNTILTRLVAAYLIKLCAETVPTPTTISGSCDTNLLAIWDASDAFPWADSTRISDPLPLSYPALASPAIMPLVVASRAGWSTVLLISIFAANALLASNNVVAIIISLFLAKNFILLNVIFIVHHALEHKQVILFVYYMLLQILLQHLEQDYFKILLL